MRSEKIGRHSGNQTAQRERKTQKIKEKEKKKKIQDGVRKGGGGLTSSTGIKRRKHLAEAVKEKGDETNLFLRQPGYLKNSTGLILVKEDSTGQGKGEGRGGGGSRGTRCFRWGVTDRFQKKKGFKSSKPRPEKGKRLEGKWGKKVSSGMGENGGGN